MANKQITPDKTQLMSELRLDLGALLVEIEDVFKAYGLPITGITLVARDPANDNMIVVLTNEDGAGLEYAVNLVLNLPEAGIMTAVNPDGTLKEASA